MLRAKQQKAEYIPHRQCLHKTIHPHITIVPTSQTDLLCPVTAAHNTHIATSTTSALQNTRAHPKCSCPQAQLLGQPLLFASAAAIVHPCVCCWAAGLRTVAA